MLSTVPSRKFYPPLGNCPLQNYVSKLLFHVPCMFYHFWAKLLTNPDTNGKPTQKPTQTPPDMNFQLLYDKESAFIYDDRKYFEESRQQSEEMFRQAAALCDVATAAVTAAATEDDEEEDPDEAAHQTVALLPAPPRPESSRCLIPHKSYSERIVAAVGDLARECQCLMKSYVKAIKRIEGIRRLEQTWSNKQLVSKQQQQQQRGDPMKQAVATTTTMSCDIPDKLDAVKIAAGPRHDNDVSTMTFTIDGKCMQGATRNGDCLYAVQMSGAGRKTVKKDEDESVSYFRTFYHESKSILNRMRNNSPVKNNNSLRREQPFKPRKRHRPVAFNTLVENQ